MKTKLRSTAKPAAKPKATVRLDQSISGVWALHSDVLNRLVRRAEAMDLSSFAPVVVDADRDLFGVANGTAIIPVSGLLVKRQSIFGALFGGETTHAMIKAALAMAVADQGIDRILLAIDSPGGTALGLEEVAGAVQAAKQHKPVFAHTAGMMASAAYFIGSQATRIFVSADAWVGSIGVLTVVDDTSKMFEAHGVRTHVIATSALKGMGVDGAPITDEHLAEFQRTVDSFMAIFTRAVARGRNMSDSQVANVADARMHTGEQAVRLGLADEVASFDDALVLAAGGTPERVTAEVPAVTPRAEQPEPVAEPDPAAVQAAVRRELAKQQESREWSRRLLVARLGIPNVGPAGEVISRADREDWDGERLKQELKPFSRWS